MCVCVCTPTVNEHYKGNRFRNQVVRQDFPTALNEQNKEKENAERQAALYHQMINEQEEADAKVARDLAGKLRLEADSERRRQQDASEQLARRLQDKSILPKKPPMPTPSDHHAIVNELPIPPKNAAIKFPGAAGGSDHDHITGHRAPSSPLGDYVDGAGPSSMSKAQQLNSQLNYVSLELNASRPMAVGSNNSRAMHHGSHSQTQYTQVMPQLPNYSPSSPTGTIGSTDGHHYERINLHSHTPEKKPAVAIPYQEYGLMVASNGVSPPRPAKAQSLANSVPDQYKLPTLPPKQQLFQRQTSDRDESRDLAIQKLSTEAFDYLMGNRATISDAAAEEVDALGALLHASRGRASTSSTRRDRYRSNMSNAQGSANNIESYPEEQTTTSGGNTDRIRQLQELGVPVEEILEIDRRITQEEKDEELARQLQAQERKTMTQEEKDHLVAMEAQDKELARMLQERVSYPATVFFLSVA